MNKQKEQYMEGDKLTCPNCGQMEFCIGVDDIWTDGDELYADCIHCLCSTLVSLLKKEYDLEKDFDLEDTENATIVLECNTCGKTNELPGEFKIYRFYGTMYDKFEPEPENWKCPDHHDSVVNMLIDTETNTDADP